MNIQADVTVLTILFEYKPFRLFETAGLFSGWFSVDGLSMGGSSAGWELSAGFGLAGGFTGGGGGVLSEPCPAEPEPELGSEPEPDSDSVFGSNQNHHHRLLSHSLKLLHKYGYNPMSSRVSDNTVQWPEYSPESIESCPEAAFHLCYQGSCSPYARGFPPHCTGIAVKHAILIQIPLLGVILPLQALPQKQATFIIHKSRVRHQRRGQGYPPGALFEGDGSPPLSKTGRHCLRNH